MDVIGKLSDGDQETLLVTFWKATRGQAARRSGRDASERSGDFVVY